MFTIKINMIKNDSFNIEVNYDINEYNFKDIYGEIEFVIINNSKIDKKQNEPACGVFSFETNLNSPQLVFIDGMFKIYNMYELVSQGITNYITFQNNDDEELFENIILSEVLGYKEIEEYF